MAVIFPSVTLFIPDLPFRGLAQVVAPAIRRHRTFRAGLLAD